MSIRILFLTLFSVANFQTFSADRIALDRNEKMIELSKNTYRFSDTTKILSINQVSTFEDIVWKKIGLNGFTPNVEWARILFSNNTNKEISKVLYLNNLFTYEADFYFVVNGKLTTQTVFSGLSRSRHIKMYPDPMYPVEISFPAHSDIDVYLRTYNPMSTTNTPLFLMDYDEAMYLKDKRLAISYLWTGILTLALALSLFLFISVRLNIFLHYLLLGIGTFMFCSANLGAISLFIDADPRQISLDYYQFGAALILIFMPRFLNGIVHFEHIFPLAWKAVKILGYAGLTTATLYLIPYFKYDFYYTTLTANILTYLTAATFLYLLVVLFVAAIRHLDRAVNLFIVYLIYFGVAFGAVLLPLLGADNNGLNTFYLILGGSIFETIAFMLLMAQVTLSIYKEREKLNRLVQTNQVIMMNAIVKSQEDERKRFAQDLHDGFGQLISSLNLNLSSLESTKTTDIEKRMNIFQVSSSILEEMYIELKNICFNLMPQTLISTGVGEALREFAHRINQSQKVIVEISYFNMDKKMTQVQEISLYRISQEWINNIIKYSDATKIDLQITRDDKEITLLIEDNGTGFDKNLLITGNGNGWKNIISRANLIKGDVELDTFPNKNHTTFILNAPTDKQSQDKKLDQINV